MVDMKFEEFVKRENTIVAADGSDVREGLLAEWKDHLEELYGKVRDLLRPYTEKHEIAIDETESVEIREERLGRYHVPTMKITVGKKGKWVSLRPVGTDVIAARGRVDMSGPNGMFKIVLVDPSLDAPRFRSTLPDVSGSRETQRGSDLAWRFVTSPPSMRYVGIDRQTFLNAVMELAGDR